MGMPPVRHASDVAIAGAGIAGITAALPTDAPDVAKNLLAKLRGGT